MGITLAMAFPRYGVGRWPPPRSSSGHGLFPPALWSDLPGSAAAAGRGRPIPSRKWALLSWAWHCPARLLRQDPCFATVCAARARPPSGPGGPVPGFSARSPPGTRGGGCRPDLSAADGALPGRGGGCLRQSGPSLSSCSGSPMRRRLWQPVRAGGHRHRIPSHGLHKNGMGRTVFVHGLQHEMWLSEKRPGVRRQLAGAVAVPPQRWFQPFRGALAGALAGVGVVLRCAGMNRRSGGLVLV